ncbi:MAG: hypothetical protein MSC56_05970 [Clostridiales bacterium]|nr:hypothetical protein [Clostridiales bacterium]
MQSEASKWNLCARSAQIMRAAGCKPSQTETQRSGFRLKACQKHFFDTLSRQAKRLPRFLHLGTISTKRPLRHERLLRLPERVQANYTTKSAGLQGFFHGFLKFCGF